MSNTSCDNGCNELHVSLGGLILVFWCLASSFLLGLGGIIAYIYFLRQGQFDDVEDIKYQMFRDDEKSQKEEE